LLVCFLWSQHSFEGRRSPSSQAKSNASWVNRAINACGASETSKVWVEPIVVFSNPDAELEVIGAEVEVVTLAKLLDLITSYNKGYSFSAEQLRLMGEGILGQASLSIKQSEKESLNITHVCDSNLLQLIA
jgi:hypothetical protein